MTIAYKRRKLAIKQLKKELEAAGTLPGKNFQESFKKHFKEVVQPQWKKDFRTNVKREESNEVQA